MSQSSIIDVDKLEWVSRGILGLGTEKDLELLGVCDPRLIVRSLSRDVPLLVGFRTETWCLTSSERRCGWGTWFRSDVSTSARVSKDTPGKVFCQLPEGIAKIGETVEATVENCDTPRCYEFNVEYNLPMAQITALTQKSTSCTQLIEFSCFSAPLQVI